MRWPSLAKYISLLQKNRKKKWFTMIGIGLLFTKHIFSQGHFQTLTSEAYMFVLICLSLKCLYVKLICLCIEAKEIVLLMHLTSKTTVYSSNTGIMTSFQFNTLSELRNTKTSYIRDCSYGLTGKYHPKR